MNWETDVEFCPDMGELNFGKMVNRIGEGIFHSDETFQHLLYARYMQMRDLFRDVSYADDLWNLTVDGQSFNNVVEAHAPKKDARLKVPVQYVKSENNIVQQVLKEENLGHDLPVWFCKNGCANFPSYRVMLISQDPFRNGDMAGSLYLSTPFGLHSADYRKGGKGIVVSTIVDALAFGRAAVYVTDALKVFARESDFVKNNYPSIVNNSKTVLEEEMRAFNPDVIMFIGKDAASMVLSECFEDTVLPTPLRIVKEVCGRERICYVACHTSKINKFRDELVRAEVISPDEHSQSAYARYYVDAILNGGWAP